MDENGSNGLHISGIIVALLLFGAWVFEQEQLTSTRPELQAPLHPNTTFQDIPARLWEDPIDAVARYRNRLDSPQEKHILNIEKSEFDKRHEGDQLKGLLTWLKDRKNLQDLIVMPVMLPGHGYAEDREARLRSRQAVLAGLGRSELSPLDGNHIGYWARKQSWSGRGTRFPMPYEVFLGKWRGAAPDSGESDAERDGGRTLGVLVLWLDSSQYDKNPMARLGMIIQHFMPDKVMPGSNQKGPAKILVPDGVTTHVRIIGPLDSGGLALMVNQVQKTLATDLKKIEDPDRKKEIGNHRSIFNRLKEYNKEHNGIVLISPTASAPAASLFNDIDEEAKLVDFFRDKLGITFIRTTATDDRLVKRLVDELELRNILPHCTAQTEQRMDWVSRCFKEPREPPYFGRRHHVVIISEWDTLYGRTLPKLFTEEVRRRLCEKESSEKEFCQVAPNNSQSLPWIHRYGYLRGIDGAIPQIGEQTKRGDQPQALDSMSVLDQTEFLEPTVGRSQYDYLRRLALQIADKDRELRRTGQGSIRAFGILGNDFFDKLLILQALRHHFRSHVYFTTDLDAGYLDPDHYPWTRNLIAASSFGLTLREEWQKMVPPARNGHQTSIFFGTLLALYPGIENAERNLSSSLQTRIFEVGRDRFFDLKPAKVGTVPLPALRPPLAQGPIEALIEQMLASEEPSAFLYPDYFTFKLPKRIETHHAALVVLATLFLLVTVTPLRRLLAHVVSVGSSLLSARDHSSATEPLTRPSSRWHNILLVLLSMALVLYGIAIGATALIEQMLASEEPFAFASGVSGWPSQIILLLAGGVAWVLVVTSYRAVGCSDKKICEQFALASCPVSAGFGESAGAGNRTAGVKTGHRAKPESRSWIKDLWHRYRSWITDLWHWYWYFPGDESKPHDCGKGQGAKSEQGNDHPQELSGCRDAAAIWQQYQVHAQGHQRIGRLLLMLVPFYAAIWLVLFYIAEPISPLRGETALWASFCIGMIWLALPFFILLFGVFDEMLICNLLVRKLVHRDVCWPAAVRDHYKATMPNMSDHMVDQWTSIRFIAERTKASGRLVYAPFVVLLFVMLSLSSRFDNWDTSGSVLGIIFLCGFIAFLSAVLVRRAAHLAKKQVLDELHGVASTGEYQKSKTEAGGARVLIDEIKQLQEGAFRKWYNEPAVRAMAWVLTIAGVVMTQHFTSGR